MLIIISPAKKLDFDSLPQTDEYSMPDVLNDASELIETLKPYSSKDLEKLMHLSSSLAQLNYDRYHSWSLPFNPQNAKQAVLTFKGDVYAGMNIESFSDSDLEFTQDHLRILSGLYGLLRPLDLMQPYRLEMGTRLENNRGKNLYEFWGEKITDLLNAQLESIGSDTLINLASNEYYKAVKPRLINGKIITPVFKEKKGDSYKVIGIYAKKARGMMSAYILKNKLTAPEKIKDFNEAGYRYNPELSTDSDWVFTRDNSQGLF
jgi:cytoplasmic iron level regulating protein YaaA (DUF328/UPF0246 family)